MGYRIPRGYASSARTVNDLRPPPRPPRPPYWELIPHSSHGVTPVESVTGEVVAHLCACGEQLPRVLHRDPDGVIVDASW